MKIFILTLIFLCTARLTAEEAQFKAYGKAITVMNLEKLNLNSKEKAAFLEGVKAALKENKLSKKDQEGLAQLGKFLDQRAEKSTAKNKSCDSTQGSCQSCP
jgi:hypothetical protein